MKKAKARPISDEESLIEEEIDHLFAAEFGETEAEQLFLAKLMSTARNGHLYLEKKEICSFPFIEEVNEQIEWFPSLVGRWEERYYLQRNWVIESRVAKELKRILQRKVKPLDSSKLEGLNEKQTEAVERGLSSGFTCITGGPGTGKTHVIRHLAASFLAKSKEKIVIAAPTGKAVGQLKTRLCKEREQFGKRIEIETLHALLGGKAEEDLFWEEKKIDAGICIVDECSMIDATLFAALLKGITESTILVLVGDKDQLPPVEAGTLFGEICHYFTRLKTKQCVELKHSLRVAHTELLGAAEEIRLGKWSRYLSLKEEVDILSFAKRFPSPSPGDPDISALFAKLHSFRLLSCLRKGPLGTDMINEAISKFFREKFCGGDVWAVPILITKSDRKLGVFNGDTAILLKNSAFPYLEKEDKAVLEKGNKYETISAALLPPFDYAYCLSVHKSQGSEYKEIALIVPPGSARFGREVLYTGVTRAREKVKVIGRKEEVDNCLTLSSQKRSALIKRLALL